MLALLKIIVFMFVRMSSVRCWKRVIAPGAACTAGVVPMFLFVRHAVHRILAKTLKTGYFTR